MDESKLFAHSTLTAGVAALVAESLLFGAFTMLYGFSVWVLLVQERARGHSTRDLTLFATSTFMFALGLVHIALDVHIALEYVINRNGDEQTMAEAFVWLNGLADSIGATKFALYVTQTLIGDGFMIYRTFVVWDRTWLVIIFPLIMLSSEVVMGYFVTFYGRYNGYSVVAVSSVNAFFVLSAATNLLSTVLIMRRTLCTRSEAQEYRPQDSRFRSVRWRVFESILQSAAIYSIASISLAITSFVSPTIAFPACHMVFPPVIGIVFLLIVVRISVNTAPGELSRHSVSKPNGSSSCSSLSTSGHVPDIEQSIRKSCPIAIHVSVSTMSDHDSIKSCDQESPLMEKGLPVNSPVVEETPMSPKFSPVPPN